MEIAFNIILCVFMGFSLFGGYQLLKDPYSKNNRPQ